MKALTIRQPWAWWIVKGFKPVENRKTNFRFRGRFIVHASKTMLRKDYEAACALARQMGAPIPQHQDLKFGGIVGSVELTNTVRIEEPYGWHQGPYGLLLSDPQELPFVPCKGWLSFWDVPPKVLAQLGRLGVPTLHAI